MADEHSARLDQINLVTHDPAAAVEFYRLLGLEVSDALPAGDPHHRTVTTAGEDGSNAPHFDIDSRRFADYWGSEDVPDGPLLGFRVSSREGVDVLYERLTAAGHRGLREPYDAFWGARFAIVLDPGGIAVGLMSPRDPERTSPPPELGSL